MNTQLRVWWIPQVPGRPFHVPVSSVQEGVRIMDVLAKYDRFQFDNNIKPDYCNAGGLEMWDLNCDGEGVAVHHCANSFRHRITLCFVCAIIASPAINWSK